MNWSISSQCFTLLNVLLFNVVISSSYLLIFSCHLEGPMEWDKALTRHGTSREAMFRVGAPRTTHCQVLSLIPVSQAVCSKPAAKRSVSLTRQNSFCATHSGITTVNCREKKSPIPWRCVAPFFQKSACLSDHLQFSQMTCFTFFVIFKDFL